MLSSQLLFQSQHRMFHFTLLFFGRYARILRFDRSGTFVSQRFNYVTGEKKLREFLRRYSRLPPEQRGHDPTVERIAPSSNLAQRMRDKLAAFQRDSPCVDANCQAEDCSYITETFRVSLDPNYSWWTLQVHDEVTHEVKCFVAGKPHFQATGARGRGTRGYVAVPLESDGTLGDNLVYLKDAWRIKHWAIEKEGVTLKRLNDSNVPYIPTLLCHGDLVGQVTQSPQKWKELIPDKECPLKEHQHYRIVVKEVGKPLSQFKNSGQLVKALWHCTKGM